MESKEKTKGPHRVCVRGGSEFRPEFRPFGVLALDLLLELPEVLQCHDECQWRDNSEEVGEVSSDEIICNRHVVLLLLRKYGMGQ
jgi:hypothetical protein